jgi:hypothetical protein
MAFYLQGQAFLEDGTAPGRPPEAKGAGDQKTRFFRFKRLQQKRLRQSTLPPGEKRDQVIPGS